MMYYYETRKNKENINGAARGFSLIELIVSIGLFTIVITIAMGAYVSLISLDRKARAVNDVVTNLSFVVDSMSRAIRTGTDYSCSLGSSSTNCPQGGSTFSFTNQDGKRQVYTLRSDNTIGQCMSEDENTPNCTSSGASPLTDTRVEVTHLTFYVEGIGTTGSNANKQPHVTFTMTGSITPEPDEDPIVFTIEGGATERLIEI